MRVRSSSRLIVISSLGRVLLFHYLRPGDERPYWGTPGGGLEFGENFEAAALRELKEETGLVIAGLDPPIERRCYELLLPTGETVAADECYYLIKGVSEEINDDAWTPEERRVTIGHKWWEIDCIIASDELVQPEDLRTILRGVEIN